MYIGIKYNVNENQTKPRADFATKDVRDDVPALATLIDDPLPIKAWNCLSFLATFDEQLAETRARCTAMSTYCDIGRDRSTLQWSYLMFDAQARSKGGTISYYESVDRFVDHVNRVAELGISDIGLHYPLDPMQLPTFERIATDVLRDLRSQFPAS